MFAGNRHDSTTLEEIEKWRAWAQLSEGSYVLRTNVSGWSDEDLWRAYIQLTDAETAFRIQKSDLSLRPVWHQKEDRVLAAHPGLLFGLRALEVPGPTLPASRPRQRTATRAGRTERTPRGRRRAAHERRPRNPHPLRDAAQRPPENPPRTPRPGTPRPTAPNRFVVEKPALRPVAAQALTSNVGEVGLIETRTAKLSLQVRCVVNRLASCLRGV